MIDLNNLRAGIAAIIALTSAALGSVMDWFVSIFPANFTLTISALLGSIPVDIALQRLVWTIGILAGLVSIFNGTKNWFKFKKKKKNE